MKVQKYRASKIYMFLARSPTISFSSIIANTLWIHEPYRIGKMPVK